VMSDLAVLRDYIVDEAVSIIALTPS
jgi:hypothetical protein